MEHFHRLLTKMIECPICQEPFGEAKFLPCHHTLCSTCLAKISETTPRGKSTVCPLCRHKFSLSIGGFPANFYITDLLEMKRILASYNFVNWQGSNDCVTLSATCENLGVLLESTMSEGNDMRQRLRSAKKQLTETEQELKKHISRSENQRSELKRKLSAAENNHRRQISELRDELRKEKEKVNSLTMSQIELDRREKQLREELRIAKESQNSQNELREKVKTLEQYSHSLKLSQLQSDQREYLMTEELRIAYKSQSELQEKLNACERRSDCMVRQIRVQEREREMMERELADRADVERCLRQRIEDINERSAKEKCEYNGLRVDQEEFSKKNDERKLKLKGKTAEVVEDIAVEMHSKILEGDSNLEMFLPSERKKNLVGRTLTSSAAADGDVPYDELKQMLRRTAGENDRKLKELHHQASNEKRRLNRELMMSQEQITDLEEKLSRVNDEMSRLKFVLMTNQTETKQETNVLEMKLNQTERKNTVLRTLLDDCRTSERDLQQRLNDAQAEKRQVDERLRAAKLREVDLLREVDDIRIRANDLHMQLCNANEQISQFKRSNIKGWTTTVAILFALLGVVIYLVFWTPSL